MIRSVQQGLLDDGIVVPVTKLCTWFDVPRRTVYYKPTKAAPKLDDKFVQPIKALIEGEPSFGYRTVAWLLGFNKNTVQHIFQIKGWQVRKRSIGARPRVEALPSVAERPNERWSTDLCRVWAGKDGWATLALVMDCHTRELLGWHLSRCGKATTAVSALEHALITRFGTLGKVDEPFLLRSELPMCCATGSSNHWRRVGLHVSRIPQARPQLWSEAGVYHAALPPTERHDGRSNPVVERAMCSSSPLRKPVTCQSHDW